MRTVVRVGLISLLVFGCATADHTSATATASNGQRVRALYDAFGRGEIPTVLAAFDPEIVWMEAESTPVGDLNPYKGPQAVAQGVFSRIGQDWDNFRVNVEQIIDGGDKVAAIGRYAATNKKTGLPLNAQFVHVWWFRNGKVVRFQQYTDTAQFARVTGVPR